MAYKSINLSSLPQIRGVLNAYAARFRWASLQLEVLCSLKLDTDICATLGQLPPKLEHLYLNLYEERIMSYPGEIGRAVLSNVLKWLLCAQRPMRSSEFCTAVAMNLSILSEFITTENILDLCSKFVVLDRGLDTFRFAHLSVREFLEKRPEYSQNSCHILAAEICLLQLIGSSKCSSAESFIKNEYPIGTGERLAPTAETIPGGFQAFRVLFSIEGDVVDPVLLIDTVAMHLAHETLKWFLDRSPNIRLTGTTLDKAKYKDEVMAILMDKCKDSKITKDILDAAASSVDRNSFEPLLARANENDIVPKDLVQCAAHGKGPGVITLLLDRYGDTSFTEIAMRRAAMIGSEDIMHILLDRGGASVPIRRLVVDAAGRGNDRIVRLLFNRGCEIDQKLLMRVAEYCSANTIEYLLGRVGEITKQELIEMLQISAKNWRHGPSLMKRLLDRAGDMEITENVLMAAIRCEKHGNELTSLLLDGGREVCFTEEVFEAAIRFLDLDETLLSLLSRIKAVGVTKGFLEAAVRNDRFGDEVLKLLMDIDQKIEITDQLVTYAAMNEVTGAEVTKLPENRIENLHVTQNTIETAALSGNRQTMEFLLDRVDNVMITEQVVINAMYRSDFRTPHGTLRLLLERARDLPITDRLLGLAVRYASGDDDTFALLWRRSHNPKIANDLVQVAVSNSAGVETLALLNRTEEVELERK